MPPGPTRHSLSQPALQPHHDSDSSLLSVKTRLNRYFLALAEHNVENGGPVRGHLPPDRLVSGHLEVEIECGRDLAVGDIKVVVAVLVGVRAVALAAARADDDADCLEGVAGLIDDRALEA